MVVLNAHLVLLVSTLKVLQQINFWYKEKCPSNFGFLPKAEFGSRSFFKDKKTPKNYR